MHEIHIWPTDVHVHDTSQSHGGLLLNPPQCFIPEVSLIANLDKGEHFYSGE